MPVPDQKFVARNESVGGVWNASTWQREPRPEVDPAFADWLGQRLHETYDAVAREPMPPDFATLIRSLEQSTNARDPARR